MKPVHGSFLVGLFLLASLSSFSQAFQKGNKNLDVGLGLGVYTSEVTFTFDWFGEPLTASDEDGTASFMIPVTFEYGITDKIGIGAELGYSNYFIDDSDTTNVSESVRSTDFSVLVQYHFLESDKNDLLLGLTLGGSSVKWKFEDGNEMTGSGSKFSIYLKDRLFLSENIGLLFEAGYVGYNYNEIDTSDDNAILESLDWSLAGFHIGTGLAVKF